MRGLRRPSRVLVFLCPLFVTMLAFAQRHEHKRQERAEIYALEEQWRQAQLSENVPVMDHLLADQFVGVTAAGQVVTKTQQLERMRTRELDLSKLAISDSKIKISGDLAVVTSLAQVDGSSDGRPMRGYFRYTRVYQREPGAGWKITNFEATRVRNVTGIYEPTASSPQATAARPPAAGASSPPASPAAPGSPRPQS